MNLAALFSGGKDSTFAIYEAKRLGHDIRCLITIITPSAESHLLHHPNIALASLQAKSMKMPQIAIETDSTDTNKEIELLRKAMREAKTRYSVEGIVHGGILSEFQKTKFEEAARSLNLSVIAPLWQKNQKQYMQQLVDSGFEFIITSVSCDGLDQSWLGRKITREDLGILEGLSKKHDFNLSFEGGEAETFVTNCPLFSAPIKITKSETHWDGYRGRFQIMQADLEG
ncbi:MAG TPA: diphthine--ammonia ligase [Candidatus Nitrosotenuis sp.]|jgi:ABC transporter with metal-binding/Fe-S-binding domain ATP-binding protein|nr:diphthine--ammonia ligase [Candidatus Nitrosotenuis sp.]